MGGLGRYDLSRHHRRAARRLDSLPGVAGNSRWPFVRISTGLDGIQGAILRSAHAIWHVALPVSNYYQLLPREEKLIVTSPALPGPIPAGAPGRSPARVKYIAQRA